MSRSYERKFDNGKLRWDLLPWDSVEQIVDILTYGEKKYDADSWKLVDDAENRYFSALLRHLIAYKQGEDIDQESSKLHLAHVATNALFLLWFNMQRDMSNQSYIECSICGEFDYFKPGAIYSVDKNQKYSCNKCMKGK